MDDGDLGASIIVIRKFFFPNLDVVVGDHSIAGSRDFVGLLLRDHHPEALEESLVCAVTTKGLMGMAGTVRLLIVQEELCSNSPGGSFRIPEESL